MPFVLFKLTNIYTTIPTTTSFSQIFDKNKFFSTLGQNIDSIIMSLWTVTMGLSEKVFKLSKLNIPFHVDILFLLICKKFHIPDDVLRQNTGQCKVADKSDFRREHRPYLLQISIGPRQISHYISTVQKSSIKRNIMRKMSVKQKAF